MNADKQTHSKITTTGSPDGDKCKQTYLIEGPGLRSWLPEGYVDGIWTESVTNDCLVLAEGFPLKVFTTIDLTYKFEYGQRGIPMDGVVRNLGFTNIATNTTINTFCDDNETK